jgi:hypothetical protein
MRSRERRHEEQLNWFLIVTQWYRMSIFTPSDVVQHIATSPVDKLSTELTVL